MTIQDESIEQPSLFLTLLESRTLLELAAMVKALPALRATGRGDGHPVLVIPGFLAGDLTTLPLRGFLEDRGYAVFPWDLGLNRGYFDVVQERLNERLRAIHGETGRKVSVIGWSLGGIYARETARLNAGLVRLVISMGSPFARNLKASVVRGLYEAITGTRADEVDPALFARVQVPPPVPATAIFSRADGIVAWQCTVEQKLGPLTENIEVKGSHCGLGHNPQVLAAIADRLAQAEDGWRPFQPNRDWQELYPDLLHLDGAFTSPPDESSWAHRISKLDRMLAILGADLAPGFNGKGRRGATVNKD